MRLEKGILSYLIEYKQNNIPCNWQTVIGYLRCNYLNLVRVVCAIFPFSNPHHAHILISSQSKSAVRHQQVTTVATSIQIWIMNKRI